MNSSATKDAAQREELDLRNIEIRLPGGHSDIGGTYEAGVRDVSGYIGELLSSRLGLPVPEPEFDAKMVDQAYTHDFVLGCDSLSRQRSAGILY